MRYLLCFMLLQCCMLTTFAQCPTSQGQTTFTSQSDVNDFATNFPTCTKVDYTVTIGGFASSYDISDLTPLSNLEAIDGDLNIFNCDNLTNLSGLENLTTITDKLFLFRNDGFSDVTEISAVTSVNSITIDDNDALSDISALNNLSYVSSSVTIERNHALLNITGFDIISNIPTLVIDNNDLLQGFDGFANLTTSNDITIADNPELTNINGLGNISTLGSLTISNNDKLPSINGFGNNNVNSISGDLDISGNLILSNFNSLTNLNSIGGKMEFFGNPGLSAFSFFNNLNTVNGNIIIGNNGTLNSLSGLDNISTMGGSIEFSNNSSLSTCAVQSVCDHLDAGGAAIITGNDTGCSSIMEVEAACVALPVELISFRGVVENESVQLHWTTASEFNNKLFEIQHSINRQNFKTIGERVGQGTTSSETNYQFTHKNPKNGQNYYRLQQTDFNGNLQFSKIISVELNRGEADDFRIFPNPVASLLFVENLNQNIETIEILEAATGRVLIQNSGVDGLNNIISIDTNSLLPNIYLLKIKTERGQYFRKVLIQR